MSISWKRQINSIAVRISLSIAVVVAATTIAVAWLILHEERRVLELELQRKGAYLAEVISHQIIEPLLYEERHTMYSLLQSTMKTEKGIVVFAEVYGADGEVIVQAKEVEKTIPVLDKKILMRMSSASLASDPLLQIFDISLPVVAKGLGTVGYIRLGITKKFLIETLTEVKKKLYLLSSVIVLSGIMAGLWMARKIIRPVLMLNQGVQRVGRGELGAKVDVIGVGEIKELSLAFNEMSARLKESVDAIKTAQENLVRTEKLYALGEFSAGLAHEIKNPLTSVKMLMQAAKESGKPFCTTDIEIIEGEINRIDRIVKEFLAFARPAKTERIATDINELVKEVVTLSRLKLEQSNITVIERLDPAIPMLMVDPDGIKQVFLNIVLNAGQAMEQGGVLTVNSTSGDSKVSVCIHDTGTGISEENLKRIFDPFFTTKEDGTGMGLAIAYSIIKEHGGDIMVDSMPDEGTMVSILLPVVA
ncbi:MAG: ATP-binding protein [Thermodesulfovibrionales bacterium]|nr:ATP-binding protein [Thermodesulfovibrionales bacterium]